MVHPEPIWLNELIGPRLCTKFLGITIDLSELKDSDQELLKHLHNVPSAQFELKSFGGKHAAVVGITNNASSLTLTFAKSPGQINWPYVPFGSNLKRVYIKSFDSVDKGRAYKTKKISSKYSGPSSTVEQTFEYEPCRFDPIDYATESSTNLTCAFVSGFLIDAEFVNRLAANKQITSLGIRNCRVTDDAFTQLIKLRRLESLSVSGDKNLTDDQVRQLHTRHGSPITKNLATSYGA